MARVVHFELAAANPERAIKFYQEVFGWEFQKWEGDFDYWLIMTGDPKQPGIDGGLVRRENPWDVSRTVVDVPSLDDAIAKITGNGGSVVQGKSEIAGVGYFAVCKDPEGNIFGLMEWAGDDREPVDDVEPVTA